MRCNIRFLISLVLQMMGRAGRPQFDDHGVACVFVHDIKKDFYKKFLYEPFPVESSLLDVLPEHLNAEIVAGTIGTKQEAIDYLTWTYFFRRLLQNPAYYGLEQLEPTEVNYYLTSLIHRSLAVLEAASCIEIIEEEGGRLEPTALGRIASYYYLSYHTLQMFRDRLNGGNTIEELLCILSDAHEYSELPVRHNEDILNGELAKSCRLPVNQYSLDSSHTKAHLLFQAHFSRLSLPCADYVTDTKSVLDQSIRILQAMMDVAAEAGWLATTLRSQQLLQMVVQAVWHDNPTVLILPHFEPVILPALPSREGLLHLPVLQKAFLENYSTVSDMLRNDMSPDQIQEVRQVLLNLPIIELSLCIKWGTQSAALPALNDRPLTEAAWVDVPANQDCILDITFTRLNTLDASAIASGGARSKRPPSSSANAGKQAGSRQGNRTAYAPKYPKPKDEGWLLTLGSFDKQELLAMKRVTLARSKCSQQLSFITPSETGRLMLTFYFISDTYVGLDQQFTLYLNVIPAEMRETLTEEENYDEEYDFTKEVDAYGNKIA